MLNAVLRSKCRRCERFRNPGEFVGPPDVGYCLHCYENHRKALDALAGGDVPRHCSQCGRSFAELNPETAKNDIRVSVVYRDGLYAVQCAACADRFERSNPQMFRNTPYGHEKGL